MDLKPVEREPDPVLDTMQRQLRFLAEGITAILDNLPVQRRPLTDSTKALHIRVILEKRNGWCPACELVRIADAQGKLAGAEFDHWFGRHRNRPEETWPVCAGCNAALEQPQFKQAKRGAYEAYQQALRPYLDDGQRVLQ